MVLEAGVAAGYVVAWAVRKARRAGGRLDAEADAVIDAGLDRLHEVVAAKLAGHPVLTELVEEAEAGGEVTELTRQQVELAIAAAARRDEAFAQAAAELIGQLQEAGQIVIAGRGPTVFTGNVHVRAEGRGIAVGQVGGDVNVGLDLPDPPGPGRPGH